MVITTTPRPVINNAQVDGSGTGVKVRTKLVPDVPRLKTPPFNEEVKPLVSIVTGLALKPTRLDVDKIDHE